MISDCDAVMADAPLTVRTVYLQMYHKGMTQKEVAFPTDKSSVITRRWRRDCWKRYKKKTPRLIFAGKKTEFLFEKEKKCNA